MLKYESGLESNLTVKQNNTEQNKWKMKCKKFLTTVQDTKSLRKVMVNF